MASTRTTIPTTELRRRSSEIISEVAYGDIEVVLTRRRKPVVAMVSMSALAAFHALEDARDAAEAARARREIEKHGAISHDEVKARLGL